MNLTSQSLGQAATGVLVKSLTVDSCVIPTELNAAIVKVS